jgi:MFS transporter, DHA2 family, multidrug resistance protein
MEPKPIKVVTNLHALYVVRVLQGIAGGCLPPMLIIVALRYLPPKEKLYGLAGYALTATFGPALGTPLAALWTEYVSWRMAFWQIVPLTYLDVLNVQKQLLEAQSNLEQSKAAAAANLITLCKVLGGGWESTYARL